MPASKRGAKRKLKAWRARRKAQLEANLVAQITRKLRGDRYSDSDMFDWALWAKFRNEYVFSMDKNINLQATYK